MIIQKDTHANVKMDLKEMEKHALKVSKHLITVNNFSENSLIFHGVFFLFSSLLKKWISASQYSCLNFQYLLSLKRNCGINIDMHLSQITVLPPPPPPPGECVKYEGMGVTNNEVYQTGPASNDVKECLQNCQTEFKPSYGAYFRVDVCECIIQEGANLAAPLVPDGHVVYICSPEGKLSFIYLHLNHLVPTHHIFLINSD